MVLLAIGIGAASRKTSAGSAFGGIFVLWLVVVACKAALVSIF
jgi:hypothetical protein